MAYVNSRPASAGFMDRVAAVLRVGKEMLERRRVYQQTLAELSSLSDRDLTDLGMSRMSISEIAREAAYSK